MPILCDFVGFYISVCQQALQSNLQSLQKKVVTTRKTDNDFYSVVSYLK